MYKITINNKAFTTDREMTILEACEAMKISIPTLCHDNRLTPHGACRLCVVDVKGARNLMAACSTPIYDGMEIETHTQEVEGARKDILELLWAAHDNNCLVCEKAGDCRLQDLCYDYDIEPESTYFKKSLDFKIDDSNSFYIYDRSKCVLCGKCIRVCEELQMTEAITFTDRGYHTHVSHPFEAGMTFSDCVSCGNCVNVCPTGALTEKKRSKARYWDIEKWVKTTCGYCGVGCQIEMGVVDNRIVEVRPGKDGVNKGLLCVKGKFAYDFIGHPERLKSPLVRKAGILEEVSWEEALGVISDRMGKILREYGSDAFGGLTSARCTTEDNYMMQKFFRTVLGSNSVDHCARL